MKIMVNGIHANLRFSAAHMIPNHESCGFIHGHSYIVDVDIDGERQGDFGFVADFKEVKTIMRDLCNRLDHRFIIPTENPNMNVNIGEDSVEFSINNKDYKIPVEDCVLLDMEFTSAEELAKYFTEGLYSKLTEQGAVLNSVSVCVNEGIGQGAVYTKS